MFGDESGVIEAASADMLVDGGERDDIGGLVKSGEGVSYDFGERLG